ncbi:hypothetical protein OG883_42570 [Streptomyces sp. NBC_01142]|uniref:hypothetical protein n=1 Tax=Streptomyces sp. NBC_01142 TaxID=2975865 RepID=UPI00225A6848|nr:hypothetical protein [Streptomyces sp. NBC_01142]MCX4826328.1 hypothetical protein [Streptomyces sp. NBC_01142]
MTTSSHVQTFHYGAWVFNIDRALTIVEQPHHDPVSTSVAAWAAAYHLNQLGPDYQGALWCPVFGPDQSHFNVEHAMQTDLDTPVIIATMEFDGNEAVLLIDGVHRMYRAMVENRPTLPAYLLTTTETMQVRER